jgi:hypothetical protein
MDKNSYEAALNLRIKATIVSRNFEDEARIAGVAALKRLYNVDIVAEEAADKYINFFFDSSKIWIQNGYILFKKNDDLSGGVVKTYKIFLSQLFSE